MKYRSMTVPYLTIGLDLGDKYHHLFALRHDDQVVADKRIRNTKESLVRHFDSFPAARVVVEAGGQSQWISEFLSALGHEVIVASSTALGSKKQRRKNDQKDAESLARKGRSDPKELKPIKHRHSSAQYDLSVIRARDCFVNMRTQAVNTARSLVKTFGERLPGSSTKAFAKKVRSQIPIPLKAAVNPLLDIIEELTEKITAYDNEVKRLAEKKYPETKRLTQVRGVGHLTALAFVLTLEDPRRFSKSRKVGAFLGLVPALDNSGDGEPQLRISKAGDGCMRRLLVNASHYILGPFGDPVSDLRHHGEKICLGGGKNAKKRAAIAVARKLSVLLHRLWASGDEYDPLYQQRKKIPA